MKRAALLPAGLFVASLVVFLWSPNHQMTDSWVRAAGQRRNLLPTATPGSARYGLEKEGKEGQPNYRLAHVGARVFYSFPVASSILSVPYVAVARLAGSAIVAPDGSYVTTVEKANQARLAALLMAAFAVIVFQTARLLLPVGPSLAIAIVTAFGTQVYSTASRTLWSHDWALVLVGGAIHLLVRAAVRGGGYRPFWLGTLAAWAYLVRPTAGLTLAGTAIYLFVVERRAAWRFAGTVALWEASRSRPIRWSVLGSALPRLFPRSAEHTVGRGAGRNAGQPQPRPSGLCSGLPGRHPDRSPVPRDRSVRSAGAAGSRDLRRALAGDLGVRQVVGRALLWAAPRHRDGSPGWPCWRCWETTARARRETRRPRIVASDWSPDWRSCCPPPASSSTPRGRSRRSRTAGTSTR